MAPVEWGGAKKAEVEEGWSLASIPLVTPGYPVGIGSCRCTCSVPPTVPSSATIYLSSPGLAAVHGPTRARSVTNSQAQADVKKNRPLASIPLVIATLLMTPGYPVGIGSCRCTCAVPPTAESSPGLAAVHGPTRPRSVTVTPRRPMGPTVSAMRLSHSLLHSHRGVLQVSLVLPQEPRVQG